MKTTLIAASVLGLSAVPAAAAMVTTDLNLRRGPGTQYSVVTAMPGGARVETGNCRANWCRVNWRGYSGWASASYLSGGGGPAYRSSGYYEPDPYYDGYSVGPGFGFSLLLGDDDHDRHRDWDRGRHRDHDRWGRGGRDHDRGDRDHRRGDRDHDRDRDHRRGDRDHDRGDRDHRRGDRGDRDRRADRGGEIGQSREAIRNRN